MDKATRTYVIPATSFHFGRPSESFLHYDNHRKMLSELFEGSKKYYCAEDIKQDLMSLAAPIAPGSTYDETARVAFRLIQSCDTLDEFQDLLESVLADPDSQVPGSLVVPALPKSEVGRTLLQPATELVRGCFAACAIAVAALVCMAATCPLGELTKRPKWVDKLASYKVKDSIVAAKLKLT